MAKPRLWQDHFALGIVEIDTQHQDLLEQLDRLMLAVSQGEATHAIKETLQFLNEYVALHFLTEETLMEHHGYPELHDHKVQHEWFKNELVDLAQACCQEDHVPGQATDLIAHLTDWLLNHVLYTDQILGTFLKDKGVA